MEAMRFFPDSIPTSGHEPGWKYLAHVDLRNDSSLKRIMTSIYSQLRGEIAAFDKDFTERESANAKRMVEEAETLKREGANRDHRNGGKVVKLEHDLLYDMLWWFASHYRQEKPHILAAARVLQQHATWFVRNPTQYRVECAEARVKWEEYRSGRQNGKFSHDRDDDNDRGGDGGGGSNLGNEDEDSMGEDSPEEVNIFKETILPGEGKTTRGGFSYRRQNLDELRKYVAESPSPSHKRKKRRV